jgi:predicted lipoprotein with Yx(FWY)xxD motif
MTVAATVLAIAAAVASAAGMAIASSGTRVVGASMNQMLGKTLVVDPHGRTLYALHPETTRHLLCRSNACLALWPPLTVRSSRTKLLAGHGVQGRLGLLRRANGRWQVTLRGLPLYRYAGDGASGEANGEGIQSFGGTWHAVTAEAHPAAAPQQPMSPPAPTTPRPAPPYVY